MKFIKRVSFLALGVILCLSLMPAAASAESAIDLGGGVNAPYSIDRDGAVSVDLTWDIINSLLEAGENGEAAVTLGNIPGMIRAVFNISMRLPPTKIQMNALKLTVNDRSVRLPYGLLTHLKIDGTLRFGVGGASATGDSIEFSVTDTKGVPVDYYNYEYPITVSFPYHAPIDRNLFPVVAVQEYADGARVNPRSWYDYTDGKVYAKAYTTGLFEALYNGPSGFGDTISHWGRDAIEYAAARGVVNGIGGNLFAPDGPVTRAQFMSMLIRTIDISPQGMWMVQQFADVPPDAYYYSDALKAKAFGIVSGVGDNLLKPDAPITRQEMFVMLHNAMRKAEMLPPVMTDIWMVFSDWSLVSDWAGNEIQELARLGLANGTGGKIDPLGTATRAEAAQTVYNLLTRDSKF
ncbi:MAG: S-layer homology domain-containing protein [Oscillospiraceae bacterium]|nr:S-layer homology domain-containing protein [Oscillospiraceae bacterium]